MSDNVELKFTGNSADAEKALAQLERKYDSLEAKLKNMRRTTKQSADDGATGFAKMASSAANVAQMVTGIGSAMDVVNVATRAALAELNNLTEMQAKAARRQITLAGAQREMTINLGRDPSLPLPAALNEARRISKATAVDEKDVTLALSSAFSQRGALAAGRVPGFVQKALELNPTAEGADVAGAMMRMGRTFNLSPDQAGGFLMQMQQQSPVKSVPELARNAVPAVMSMSAFGYNPEQSAELAMTLAQRSGDIKGEMTKTASIQLASRISEVLPGVPLADAIGRIRGDKSLQGELFKKDFGEAQFKPIFRELFQGGADSPIMQAYGAAQAGITDPRQAAGALQVALGDVAGLPAIQTDLLSRTLMTGIGQAEGANTAAARAGVVMENFPNMLQSAGVGYAGQFFAQRQLQARVNLGGQDPVEAAAAIMEPMIREGERYARNAPSASQREQNREMVNILKEMKEQLIQLNRNQRPPLVPRGANVEAN